MNSNKSSIIFSLVCCLFFNEAIAETTLLCSISESKTKNIDWILGEKFKFSEKNLSRSTGRNIKGYSKNYYKIEPEADNYQFAVIKIKKDNDNGTKNISVEVNNVYATSGDVQMYATTVDDDFQVQTDRYYLPIKIRDRQYTDDQRGVSCYRISRNSMWEDCYVSSNKYISINRETLELRDIDNETTWREYEYGFAQLMNYSDEFKTTGKGDRYYCSISDEDNEKKLRERYSQILEVYKGIHKREHGKIEQKKIKDKKNQQKKNKI